MPIFEQGPCERGLNRLTKAIIEDNAQAIGENFIGVGIAAPTLCWNPREDQIPAPELNNLLRYWRGLQIADRLPRYAKFDPLEVPSMLGYLMLVDVVDQGEDFVFRVYGSQISRSTGFDMTGKRLSNIPTHPSLVALFLSSFQAVTQQRLPLLSSHQPPPTQPIRQWTSLTMPMVDENENVGRLLIGSKPI
jgi:hypothetical protein